MLRTAVIGLGKQSINEHIPAIIRSNILEIVAVCDTDWEKVFNLSKKLNIKGYCSVIELIKNSKVDLAIVAVPHNQYLPIISALAKAGINIIKEKPFAVSLEEANILNNMVYGKVFLGVALQRRFDPIYQEFFMMRDKLGKIYSIEGKYTLNIADLSDGWRASKSEAGGGVVVDLGYHLIDLLVWYFGLPNSITAFLSRKNRPMQQYDVEDTASVLFDYHNPLSYDEKTIGNLILSRVYPRKQELLVVHGTEGIIELQRGQITRYDKEGNELEKLIRDHDWYSAMVNQITYFSQSINKGKTWDSSDFQRHLPQVAFIQAVYDSDKRGCSCKPEDYINNMGGKDGKISNLGRI